MNLKTFLIVTLFPLVTTSETKNMHSPCRILLNEFSTSFPPFVEVGKFCPPQKENVKESLDGYYSVIVDAEDLRLVDIHSLKKLKLKKTEILYSDETMASKERTGKHDDAKSTAVTGATGFCSPSRSAGNVVPESTISGSITTVPAGAKEKVVSGNQQKVASGSLGNPSPGNILNPQSSSPHAQATKSSILVGQPQNVLPTGSSVPSTVPLLNSPSNLPAQGMQSTELTGHLQETSVPSSLVRPSTSVLLKQSPPAAPVMKSTVETGHAAQTRPAGSLIDLPTSISLKQQPSLSTAQGSKSTVFTSEPKKAPTPGSSAKHSTSISTPAKSSVHASPDMKSTQKQPSGSVVYPSAPTLLKTQPNPRAGQGSSQNAQNQASSSCDSCSTPAKIPRRNKRHAEFQQKNIWGMVPLPLELVFDPTKTYAVILLYLPCDHRTRIWDKYPVGQSLTDEARAEIVANIQDLIVISSESEETDISKLVELLPEAYDVAPLGTTEAISDYSFSKCDSTISSFNADGFLLSERTPGSPNKCPIYETVQPFSFKGKVLRKQTQEVVVNVVTNLKEKMNDDAWRKLNPVDAAASILNLSKKTVNKILSRYEDGDAFSDGKFRCRKKPTTDLDSTQQDILYRCIVEPYSQNRIPRFVNIWKCFVDRVRSYQREERSRKSQAGSPEPGDIGDDSPTPSISEYEGGDATVEDEEASHNLYHCSAKSFSKILDKYGYDYGKIRNRDAQVFRPSNLKWRAMYLEAIRKYEADPAWNVVYQDETWIDPHQRHDRGWVRRKYDNFLQRLDFTFKNDKISRGSRLIVLAAGGNEGFIKEATEVYAVPVKRKGCKSQADECPDGLAQDYHDNVKGPKFLQWLEKLFKILEHRPTVFVMDNCPFHKVLAIPKTSDLKETIRKWLEDKKREGYSITEDVSQSTKLTKAQLLAIVHRLTDETNGDQRIPRTQIQQLAARYGHRILHIPPYNCDLNPIEYVWNDIKSQVKEENTEQTVKQALTLAREKLSAYTAEEWRKKIQHVRKREDAYLIGDKVFAASTDEEVITAEPLTEEDLTSIEQEAGLSVDCVEPE